MAGSGIAALIIVAAGYNWFNSRRDHSPVLLAPSLKELANKQGVQLGNFAILNHLSNKPYTDILSSQFNFVLADNTPNWYFTGDGLRPTATTYDFSKMDQVVKYAETNNMPIQAHHLVWGEQKWLPDWLKNGNYTSAQLLDIIHDHIKTVVGRYAGQIETWSVVNEAFTRSEHLFNLNDWWADHIGSDSYIDRSFIWAHQADPNAKLIINDFNNEAINDTSNAMYDYVKGALARNVPINGIGMQMHIDGSHPPTKDEVASNMKRFAALGLDIYVTEFDVNMNDVKANDRDKDNIEGNIYYEMMRACIESRVCHSFAYLGITDQETWYNYIGLTDPRPLMFDKHYNPKPAFWSTRTALQNP